MSEFPFENNNINVKEEGIHEEIERLEYELDYFYKKRRLFLILGLLYIVLGIASIFPLSLTGIVSLSTISALIIVGGIIFLVLRGALYNNRISSRKTRLDHLKSRIRE